MQLLQTHSADKIFFKKVKIFEKSLAVSIVLLTLGGCVYEPYPGPPPPPSPYVYAPPPGPYYAAPGPYYYPEYPPVGIELGVGRGGWGHRWR